MRVSYKKQHEEIIEYDNYEVGRHRFDFLVENEIIVELKTIKNLEDIHFAIVRSYLKSIKKKHGLLFNFSKMPLEIKRVIYE
jgi:GxxExxY protein